MKRASRKQEPQHSFFKVLGVVVAFSLLVFIGAAGFSGRFVAESEESQPSASEDIPVEGIDVAKITEIVNTPECLDDQFSSEASEIANSAPAQQIVGDVINEVITPASEATGESKEELCETVFSGLPVNGIYLALSQSCAERALELISMCQAMVSGQ